MISFITYFFAMEYQCEGTVSKMQFYKNSQDNTLLFDSLARTYSLFSAFLHKDNTYSLKLRFMSISKTNNFCLLLSQIFRSLY